MASWMNIEQASSSRLPYAMPHAVVADSMTAPRRREDVNARAVLLVSPKEAIRDQVRRILQQPRWNVVEVCSGAEAYEHLHEEQAAGTGYGSVPGLGSIQVLLLDEVLPDLDPIELATLVQRDFPAVQVLILDSQEHPGSQVARIAVRSQSPTAVSLQLSELLGSGSSTLQELTKRPPAEAARNAIAPRGHENELRGKVVSIHDSAASHSNEDPSAFVLAGDRLSNGGVHAPISLTPERLGGNAEGQRLLALRTAPEGQPGIRGMVGNAPSMQRVYALAHMVAGRDTTVVVTGESGTGKDLVAQAIHLMSPRQRQPFIVINCAAIPEPLLEAELFGYVKGSFTGATQSRIGRIHAAHGGTLFLDEIGDMPLALQSKILRFLEQGEVQRLGGNDNLKVDVRVVAATNADLKSAVEKRLFREDLYYRLMVFPIVLPPLRERLSDVQKLSEAFLARFAPGAVLGSDALAALEARTWHGNVRELRNVIERATILAGDALHIGTEHILS